MLLVTVPVSAKMLGIMLQFRKVSVRFAWNRFARILLYTTRVLRLSASSCILVTNLGATGRMLDLFRTGLSTMV